MRSQGDPTVVGTTKFRDSGKATNRAKGELGETKFRVSGTEDRSPMTEDIICDL